VLAAGHECVGGLVVAVDDASLVRGVERGGELCHDPHGSGGLQRAAAREDLAEIRRRSAAWR
jgi:hypothetical protein